MLRQAAGQDFFGGVYETSADFVMPEQYLLIGQRRIFWQFSQFFA